MTNPEPNETTSDAQAAATQEYAAPRLADASTGLFFWLAALGGTIAAGGVFGAWVGFFGGVPGPMLFTGLFMGALIAGVVAIPIHLTVAIMTWMLWMSRFRVISAGLAGGTTGVVATQFLSGGSVSGAVLWAGVIGAMGGAAAGAWANPVGRNLTKTASGNPVWQFTLRDLFLRMTVFAMLVAAWTWAIRSVYDAR